MAHDWSGNVSNNGEYLDIHNNTVYPLDTTYGFDFDQFDADVPTTVYNAAALTTAAIQAAINTADANGGGIVQLPAGTGTLNDRLVFKDVNNILLQGDSNTTTILNYTGGDKAMIDVQNCKNVAFRDFRLNNNGSARHNFIMMHSENFLHERLILNGTSRESNITVRYCKQFTVRYNTLSGSKRHGIGIKDCYEPEGVSAGTVALCSSQYTTDKNNRGAIYGTAWTEDFTIYSNIISGHVVHGINNHGLNAEVAGNSVTSGGYFGKMFDGHNIKFHNNYMNNCTHGLMFSFTLLVPGHETGLIDMRCNTFGTVNSPGTYTLAFFKPAYTTSDYEKILLDSNTFTVVTPLIKTADIDTVDLHVCTNDDAYAVIPANERTTASSNDCIGCSSVVPVIFNVDFTASPTTGDAPLTVTFTDTSTPASGETMSEWVWSYSDDGVEFIEFSRVQNPVYTFYCTGTYIVTLTATDTAGNIGSTNNNFIVNNTATGACTSNIVSNNDFATNDLTSWTFFTDGTASANAATGSAVVTTTDQGTNTQLYQQGLSVTSGTAMVLEFTISATAATTLRVSLLLDNSPFTILGLNEVINVTTSPQTFNFPFVVTGTTADARLRFNQFKSGTVVTIDDVCLGVEGIGGGGGTITASASVSPLSGDAPLTVSYNGSGSTSTSGIDSYVWQLSTNGGQWVEFDDVVSGTIDLGVGTHEIRLVVGGDDGCDSDNTQIVVTEEVVTTTLLPSTSGKYNINNVGTISLQSYQPSWFDLFINSPANLMGIVVLSYNIFTGLGQAFDICTDNILTFNIDTGNYRLENCDGGIINTGTDARLAAYGLAHPIAPNSVLIERGEAYWDWYQNEQNTLYGVPAETWPTLFENQFITAQGL